MSDTFIKLTIKALAEEDRPREKLMLKGRHSLSDAELLAILLGSGTREKTAVELAREMLSHYGSDLQTLGKQQVRDLCRFKGIGEAKAITLVAALELGLRKRLSETKVEKVKSSRDAYEYFVPVLSDLRHEEFWILMLNRNNRIIRRERISQGGVAGTAVDAKLIFKPAIQELASSIVLAHNHPSGNTQPSEADIKLTRQLANAGKTLDIPVCDHLILGGGGFFSFADEGLLSNV
jgi:DNA repair protein RadC